MNFLSVQQQLGWADVTVENPMTMKTIGGFAQHSEQWNEFLNVERLLPGKPLLQRSAIGQISDERESASFDPKITNPDQRPAIERTVARQELNGFGFFNIGDYGGS